MTDLEIPAEVLHFLEQHIDTVPHLEALLLIWDTMPLPWTETSLAARIYVDLPVARRILLDLERRGFIAARSSAEGYVYLPEEGKNALLSLVATTYRLQLIPVARLIHSKGSPAMREFARAFQLKGDK